MKRKGFTLIELLAVIVVLAIIALIATPIVMNVIKNAQMGAAERSADNYVKAVETLIATKQLDGIKVEDGTYTIDSNGNLAFGDVEVSGTKPNGGTIKIENGQVVKNESSIKVGDYTVTYKDGVASATEETGPVTLASCMLKDGEANTVGAKYTCDLGNGDRTFYVLEVGTSSKPVTLILEGNYDMTTQSWCASGSNNSCNADGLNEKLDEISDVWSRLDRNQIGIPSAEQLMIADGKNEDAYLDGACLSNEWLRSYPGNPEWNEYTEPPYGYWLSNRYQTNSAWYVEADCGLYANSVSSSNWSGVRPIITLPL